MAERHARMLQRLAEISLSLAEAVHQDALQAQTPAERAEAARAFQAVARSARQSMALEARLAREHAEAHRRQEAEAAQRREEERASRHRRLRSDVEHLAWTEHEDEEEVEALSEFAMSWLLDEEDRDAAAFLAEPYEAQLARLCRDIGIDPPSPDEAPSQPPEEPVEPAAAPAEPPLRSRIGEPAAESPDWRGYG